MRINLDDDKMVEVTIRRQAYMYSYFIGDKRIGVFDPNVMEDNILILNNTVCLLYTSPSPRDCS